MAEPVALPSSFTRRAPVGLALLLFPLSTLVVDLLVTSDDTDWVLGAMYGVVGVVILVRAWVLRRRPALLLDEEGIREWDGTLLLAWSQAALIWVGDQRYLGSRRFLRFPSLMAWTAPSLDYARRTGFVAEVRLSRSLATTLPAAEVAELIRRFTTAEVRTGDAKELRRLLAELRSPGGHQAPTR